MEEKHKVDELLTWPWWHCWKFCNGKRCDLQWFEGRLAWVEGSYVQQGSGAAAVLSQLGCARAPWPGQTEQSAVPWLYHDILLSSQWCCLCPECPQQVAAGLCCLLGCDWDGLGEGRLSHARDCSNSLNCWTELLCSGPDCEGITQKTSVAPCSSTHRFLPAAIFAPLCSQGLAFCREFRHLVWDVFA